MDRRRSDLGFGLIEAIGGFIARSQALKADSLDFIGDGSITLIGLLALGWANPHGLELR